jgi:hypothetical protein
MLTTMRALSYRQMLLNGAKDRLFPGPASFRLNGPIASRALKQRRPTGPVNTDTATVWPEGNNR